MPSPVRPDPRGHRPDPEHRDLALIQAHRAGDPHALAELLESHQNRLYAVCLRMTNDAERARDLTQDALVKIIQGLGSFAGRSRVSTWMIRIAINVCLTDRRRSRLRKTAPLAADGASASDNPTRPPFSGRDSLGASEPDAAERVQLDESKEALRLAMQCLEPSQRALLILRDMQELDYQSIADVLDVPEGTVKSRLFRARAALRDEMLRLEGRTSSH